ncbi:hypothetical protein HPB47_001867 [Ixodes persulcatus]|uniref:Uncharacterized protein n=1 Tax=Ixodes persulcatus TaxID=34615 RepID=A0AC60PMV3_IXOPE|nr:hypothetical protein HPB47_001867 [Ixodes persulcatus]
MQISRKEISLELQLLGRVLPSCLTNLFGSGYRSHPSYLFIVDAASRLLEASWKEVIAGVTASCRKLNETKFEPPVLLCNTALSSDTMELLSKGPKFAPDLPTKKVDQLAAVHQVASAIPEPQRQDFLGSAIRAVCFHPPPKPGKISLHAAIEELRQEHLKLLESDKTGVFVVLEEGDFGDKVLGTGCRSLMTENKFSRQSWVSLPMRRNLYSRPSRRFSCSFKTTSIRQCHPAKKTDFRTIMLLTFHDLHLIKKKVQEVEVEHTKEYRYLGVTLQEGPQYLEHERNTLKTSNIRKGHLWNMAKYSYNPYTLARALWKSVAVPAVTYANDAVDFRQTTLKTLDRHQVEIGRWTLGGNGATANLAVTGEMAWSTFKQRDARTKL